VDGLATLLKKFPDVKAFVHSEDMDLLRESNATLPLEKIQLTFDNFELCLGEAMTDSSDKSSKTTIKFVHTPGHTKGSQCILVNGSRLFTGDTLFCNSCGRVDFPESNKKDMTKSLTRILSLPGDTVVYPGHRYDGEWTTIEKEKHSEQLFKIMKASLS
jgi:glyoxylase-like metal-dependent hydrolase (beta-lactamase superfamily II)